MEILKFRVHGLRDAESEKRFRDIIVAIPGVTQVDINSIKEMARIVSEHPISLEMVRQKVSHHGFAIDTSSPSSPASPTSPIIKLAIDGMHCRSCEITIERKFKMADGVKKVDVDAGRGTCRIVCNEGARPSIGHLQSLIRKDGYTIREEMINEKIDTIETSTRPSFWHLAGFFVLALVAITLLRKAGLLKSPVAIGASMSVTAAFVIGLVAATSSCIAVAGGLLLASAQAFHDRYGGTTPRERMRPVVYFVVGRIASYAILGGLIGAIGNALSPSPLVTGMIMVIAAVYMFIMGLDMLKIAPPWMKRFLPRPPKSLSHAVMDQHEKQKGRAAPLMMGALTFFLPCGFTQALQLYVLTTGSVATGALILGAFAVGTAPALLALGWASGSFKGALGKFFFKFTGAFVVLLGLWNVQNGLSAAGYPIPTPRFSIPAIATTGGKSANVDSNVRLSGGEQIVDIDVSYAGYWPDNFTLRRGIPTRFRISGEAAGAGCLAGFQIPKLGIRTLTKQGQTSELTFTPDKVGTFAFSCSMGMYRGSFTVVDS